MADPEKALIAQDVLAAAETVGIVVHGVGDHSPVEILEEAEKGFTALQIEGGFAKRVEIPSIAKSNKPHLTLVIEIHGTKHVIVPVVWSGFRERAAVWAAYSPSLTGPLDALTRAAPALLLFLRDMLLCLPETVGLWKAPMLAIPLILASFLGFLTYTFSISLCILEYDLRT